MMGDSFDPFALEGAFDPLHHQVPLPPQRQGQRQRPAAGAPTEIGAGNRLAHLLPRMGLPPTGPETAAVRLHALEDEVGTLTARLDGLQASLTTRLDQQRDQLLEAVATLLDERSRARR